MHLLPSMVMSMIALAIQTHRSWRRANTFPEMVVPSAAPTLTPVERASFGELNRFPVTLAAKPATLTPMPVGEFPSM